MHVKWSEHQRGRSSQQRKREAEQYVFNLLPNDQSKVQWSRLKEQAQRDGVSSATVSSHLKELRRSGFVTRTVDGSSYPTRVYYSKTTSVLRPKGDPEKEIARLHRSGSNLERYIGIGTSFEISQLLQVILSSILTALAIEKEYYSWGFTVTQKENQTWSMLTSSHSRI